MITLIIMTVLVSGLLFGAIYLFPKHRKITFTAAAFAPAVLVTARLITRAFVPNGLSGTAHLANILQGLPFTMCAIAAILLPVYVFTKNKFIFSLLYFFTVPGAFLTLFLDSTASRDFADFEMWAFYIPHILYFLLPIVLIIYDNAAPRGADMKWVWLTILGIITVVHLMCISVNAAFGTAEHPIIVNYIFTVFPGDYDSITGEFVELPILGTAYHIARETPYFYLWLLLPVIVIVDLLLYAPFYFKNKRNTITVSVQ